MASVNQMRLALSQVYSSSEKWKKRVAKMTDKQVIALYYKFLSEQKIKV